MVCNATKPLRKPEPSGKTFSTASARSKVPPRVKATAIPVRKGSWSGFRWLVLLAAFFGVSHCAAQTAPIRDITTKYEYDPYGNVSQVIRSTGDGYVDSRLFIYEYDPRSWLVAMPAQLVDSSVTPSHHITTRATEFISDRSSGALLSQTMEPNGDEATYKRTTYQLDSHGVLVGIKTQDRSGQHKRRLTAQLDAEDIYPRIITNSLGQSELFAVHPAFGVVALRQEVNGVKERLQYDSFGRLKHVSEPDGGDVYLSYRAAPFFTVDTKYSTGQLAEVIYDADLNEVEHDSTGFDGAFVKLSTSYNGQDLIAEQDGPCFQTTANCASEGLEQYAYDELGRLIIVRHADGSVREERYSGLKVTEFDELRNERYEERDQLDRVVRSVAIADNGRELSTTFKYEPFALLSETVDAYGNIVRSVHDVRGRQITLNDPDLGNHIYKWSTFDELNEEQDGKGFLTTYHRDNIGRITTIKNKDGKTTFCWDSSPNGIGDLSHARSASGVDTSFEYDRRGRIVKTAWTIGVRKYSFGTSYDPLGRIDTITYPSISGPAFAIKRNYNQFGFLSQAKNANTGTVYWQLDSQNERGQPMKEELGNGLTTLRVYDVRGRLATISTTRNGATQQHFTYSYFPTGSLQCRSNDLVPFTVIEQFNYDALDRLRHWSVGTEPRIDLPCPLGKTDPAKVLEQAFNYNDIGNLKQRNTLFGETPNLIYQYGQNGAGPHAVTQVNSDLYTYNGGGDQISGPTRTVDYTAFSLPSRIKQGSDTFSFKYDVSHERVIQKYPNGEITTYVAGLYEKRVRKGKTTEVFYVQGLGRLVAQVQRPLGGHQAQDTFFYHPDHLGSVQEVTSEAGAAEEQVWYDPSGQTVSPSNPGTTVTPLPSVDIGFTQQIADGQLGLINMKGRIYDPKIDRFLTPDPIVQDPLRSESLNRYSYAWNNPLKWVDPSGFQDEVVDAMVGGYLGDYISITVLPSTPLPLGPAANGANFLASASDNGMFHLVDTSQLTCDLCEISQMPDYWNNRTRLTEPPPEPPPMPREIRVREPTISAWRVDDPLNGVPNKEVLTSSIQDALVVSMVPQLAPGLAALRAGQSLEEGTALMSQGKTGQAAISYGMAAMALVPDLHGNSLESRGLHEIYVMRDVDTGQIYHFGETGRDIHVRGAEWQAELWTRYGKMTEPWSLGSFEGKAAAKAMETRYIRLYERIFGHKPGFFDDNGNFIQTQKTEH